MERVRLYPTARQVSRLTKMRDVTRQLYNAALEARIEAYCRRGVSVTASMQYRELTELRAEDARVASVYRECSHAALRKLDLAFGAFFRRLKRGEKPGFPRFRAASRWATVVFPHGCRALHFDERQLKVTVPGVGRVRLRKGRLVAAFGRAMISRRGGRWYGIFECDRVAVPLAKTGEAVGLDRGVGPWSRLRMASCLHCRRVLSDIACVSVGRSSGCRASVVGVAGTHVRGCCWHERMSGCHRPGATLRIRYRVRSSTVTIR